ncbi:glucuronate isomerase [Reichenbachiella carrageenanivorans]|uniref:Uronate isomerase n=1 Tax=Reichenbachiella carrageenanivorans TaxID=2979869 RepID=A0ABY6D5A5_9BACT|nr:glucuronate isomerase [Reichenbachiella carrageenanivorans]UXX81321.1 glucuronate isomerase [Reichenbachiella carrageenanivorans]
MKNFLDKDFLLANTVAEELYHDYAADMPIIDYHNHLIPAYIAEDHQFSNITEAWLGGDHYKWRAMRANGIDKKYITGEAPDDQKFQKWAETVPYTLRNPLYHWTHLELQRYFGISDLLDGKSAAHIYTAANEQLQSSAYSCQGLLKKMNVEVVCTTDDPIDDLRYHKQVQNSSSSLNVFPSFRPDKALGVDHAESYNSYLDQLASVCNTQIVNLDDLLSALQSRVDYFHQLGGRLSDLGFNTIPLLDESAPVDRLFAKVRGGQNLAEADVAALQAHLLLELCKMYHAKGWTQQFHLGALRNNNDRGLRELGPDTGFDSIGDFNHAVALSKFLNKLDDSNQLAKTILYNLNPRDNDLMATMAGNFNDGETVGKIQFGTGWWFLDQKTGMEAQMNSLSNMGLLSRFVGMLTDSRSFLSFPRHEYFRRILCNLLGTDVANGELPHDIPLLGQMVKDICYHNAKAYFDFDLKE